MAPPAVAAPVATSIAPSSRDSLTAVAGDAVTELPSVIVKDQRGAAMPGVPVTFTVTGGGGTITGSSATTNAFGVATVGGWTLGAVAGSNSLTASTSGLTPVVFIATGTDGGAACGGSAITCVYLPTLGGAFSWARAVNDGGVVVGLSADNTGASFAVRWTRTSGGSWSINSIAGPDAQALAINVNGAAVGVRAGRAKLWPAGGGEIDLGPGEPRGINSAETVVGVRKPNPSSEASWRAVFWRKPSTGWLTSENASQDLPSFPGGAGETGARAINDAGIIAGSVAVNNGFEFTGFRAVRWDPAGNDWMEPTPLAGSASTFATSGRAINDNVQPDFGGHIRECFQSCSAVGVFWPAGGSRTSLEPFFGGGAGTVEGMNNAQRVVGFRDTSSEHYAFVWWPGRTSVLDLGTPPGGHTHPWAYDINNLSPAQAVGYGQDEYGSRAIVWTIP